MNDEDIFASDVVFDFDADLSVGKTADFHLSKINLQNFGDLFGESTVGVSGENEHFRSA